MPRLRLSPLVLALLFAAPAALAQTLPPGVEVSVGGKVHADARAFPGGPVGEAPGLLLRRARAEVEVEVAGRFRAVVEPGFGEGEVELLDGYAEADIWGGRDRALAVRVGRFKTPVGYESLRSSSALRFAERALPTALSPRRDLGAMLHWDAPRLEAQAGVFNGVPDGSSASVDWGAGPDAAARVFGTPLETGSAAGPVRLGLGLAVMAGTAGEGEALADYETSGDRTVFAYAPGVVPDGRRVRLAPQATLDVGRLHVVGEVVEARHRVRQSAEAGGPVRDLAHRAWQVAASYVLVGRPQGDARPVPVRSVAEGGPGAVEVSARVHGLAVDDEPGTLAAAGSARRATAWALAVHWSPVAPVRLGLTAERAAFDAFGGGGAPEPETFVVLRGQIDL